MPPRARLLKVGLGGRSHLDGEFVALDADKRMSEFVDCIVRAGYRAVSAGIAGFQAVGGKSLLPYLHRLLDDVALAVARAAAAFVECELGVDQITLVGREPFSTVESAVGLLAAGERDLHRSLGPVARFLETDQGIDEYRGHRFVIERTATIEVTILLNQCERVTGPVLSLRLDDVEMGDRQKRLESPGRARIDGNQPAFLRM